MPFSLWMEKWRLYPLRPSFLLLDHPKCTCVFLCQIECGLWCINAILGHIILVEYSVIALGCFMLFQTSPQRKKEIKDISIV